MKHLLLIVFFLVILLISGCGERTTVYEQMTNEVPALKPNEALDVTTLQIVSFSFDSGNVDSPVTVRWEADGNFPEGFILAWDADNPAPMPGEHGWVAISDSDTREIQVKLNDKVSHYFRICRVKDSGCDVFSETIQVVFPDASLSEVSNTDQDVVEEQPKEATKTLAATPTMKATDMPEAVIEIKEITTDQDGVVTVKWKLVSGSAPLGFRVSWSHTNTNPTPEDESIWVKDPAARSLAIEGFGRGYEYSFSVCQATEEGCNIFSNSQRYKVPPEPTKTPTITATPAVAEDAITLTGLSQTAAGQVKLTWVATGSFPKGFKVVWSKTSAAPVFPGDSYAYVSDPSVRQAYIKDLIEGKTYYFRICRYTGSVCDLYSNTMSITLSGGGSEESTITLKSVSDAGDGAAKLVWTATGSFPNGFKIAYSSHNTTPVYPGDEWVYVSNGATRSVIIDGLTKGETYYFRVCKYLDGGCSVYSNMISYLVPGTAATKTPKPTATPDGSTISLDSVVEEGCGAVRVNWTAVGSFPLGFKVVWSDVHDAPVFPGDSYYYESSPAASTVYLDGFTEGVTYYFRVCRYDGSACNLYSNSVSFPVAVCPTPEP
jgi:hypothetical protein